MDSVLNNFIWMIQKFINLDPVDQVQQPEAESAEDKASESRPKCLNVLLIIRQLIQHVSNAELIKLSKVNKVWNFEARSEMRDRGSFTAHIRSAHPCQDLVDLALLLPTMNVMPFAGISIDLNASHVGSCSIAYTEQLASIYRIILNELPWKKISIKLTGNLTPDMMCPAVKLMIQVLQNFCGNFEELSLQVDPSAVPFLENVIQNSKFPRLRTLRYEADDTRDSSYDVHKRLIQAVISRAGKNPLALHLMTYVEDVESTLEGDTTVELVHDYEFNPVQHLTPDSAIDKLKLRNLTLSFQRLGQALSFQMRRRIVPELLGSSRTYLSSLRVDLVSIIPVMHYRISFKNLKRLKIDVGFNNEERAQPEMLKLLRAFDFASIFPRLEKLNVALYSCRSVPWDDISQFAEQGDAICMEPIEERRANIKHLAICSTSSSPSEDSAFPILAQLFPHMDRLSLETNETRDFTLFGPILKHWADLKELEVRALFGKYALSQDRRSVETINENLDSEFCGIFPQEVAELRKMNDEYLKAVNIVPVMPSITCLTGLRRFKLLCGTNCYPFGKHNSTFVFSKVTCLLVFARLPDLVVTLESNSGPLARALSHVKPYAYVALDEVRGKFELH